MSAKEMFEDLGYTKYKEYNDGSFEYYEPFENFGVLFHSDLKLVNVGDGIIDMDLFNAIHQQLIELGWLDE